MTDGQLLRRLFALYRPYRQWMLLGLLLAMLTLVANVGLMAVAGVFIASMAIAGLAGTLINYFLPSAAIRGFAIIRTGGRYFDRLVSHEATFRLLAALRLWLFRRLLPLQPGQLQDQRSADLIGRLQGDIDTLQHAYLRLFAPVMVACLSVVVITPILALFSPAIALVLLALLGIAGAIVPLAMRRASRRAGEALVENKTAMRVAVIDGLQGMADVQVYGAPAFLAGRLDGLNRDLLERQRQTARYGSLAEGTVGLCMNLALWAAALLAIWAVGNGLLVPEHVPMLALAALASFEAVAPLPMAMQKIGEIVASARRVFALADIEPEPVSGAAVPPEPADHSILVSDLRLRYPGSGQWALDGVSFDVPSGGRIAIVGPSGSGKSSIGRVLLRLWEHDGGTVMLGGHPLRDYSQAQLTRLISLMSQDIQLMTGTIRANLLMAAPDADDAALERALEVAQIHDFIAALPDGLDSWIGEGGLHLSKGQAQRLGLARILLRDAPIVVLDEPTEGLDPETARRLVAALDEALTGRTVIVITHQYGYFRGFTNHVVRLEGGRVAGAA